ncbi:hypothetical protein [Saccharibacillus alkalitolerans]|uniref:DUF3267 domain-containing protein n=1 Tax=Saccharibacillus alkalitolerans TaxID=2705290 RepID=A0ABX0F8K8_9BACL|nr:hypothetical protein [Saccharibacillus alkalitolerans]NGZ76775.1 hypothetical protein [Saccharibacillus alkalitolerans]
MDRDTEKRKDAHYAPLLLVSLFVSISVSWIALLLAFAGGIEAEAGEETFGNGVGAFAALLLLGAAAVPLHAALHALLLPFVVSRRYRLPFVKELTTQRKGYTAACAAAGLLTAAAVCLVAGDKLGLNFPQLPFLGANIMAYAFWLMLAGARVPRLDEEERKKG